jgi:hypothetical protein
MAAHGSPEYDLTWKHWDMPSGPPICALRASGRRTSGKDCIGWPTPSHSKNSKNSKNPQRMKEGGTQTCLADAAWLAGWPTPNAIPEGRGGLQTNPEKAMERKLHGHQMNLDDMASLAGRVTPSTRDWKDTPGMAETGTNPDGTMRERLDQLPRQAQLVMGGWTTPQAHDVTPRGKGQKVKHGTAHGCADLNRDAEAAGWSNGGQNQAGGALPADAAGTIPSGYPAATEKRGALNPALSRWLMGFPPEWDACAATATPSSRRSRRNS